MKTLFFAEIYQAAQEQKAHTDIITGHFPWSMIASNHYSSSTFHTVQIVAQKYDKYASEKCDIAFFAKHCSTITHTQNGQTLHRQE